MRSLLLALFVGLLFMQGASAHDQRDKFNINQAVRGAEFIVLGQVTDVSYATSKGGDRTESLPHTFVTYQIKKVIKGNPRQGNDKFTLRFLGGRGEQASFMHPSNYPLFDIGDQDILFIQGNTVSPCPLLRCGAGRFRGIQDAIFNDKGQEVVQTKRGDVDFGKFHSLPEITTHKVSQTTLFLKEGPSEGEGTPEPDLPIGSQFKLEGFIQFIDAKVKALYPPDVLDKWPTIPSADPSATFAIKPILEFTPRRMSPVPYQPVVPPSQSDLLEQREYEKNQNNPVLKN